MKETVNSENLTALSQLHPVAQVATVIAIGAVVCVGLYSFFKFLGGGWDR